ncbi:MAG TPA: prepilin-type N-terminal cleavage/methylation domain-containing protein [Opitutaceae bacterium]|nr:prepilin-type N-terminal cleavage/methylation domain-containing protein [Opitutaceae bacterium]
MIPSDLSRRNSGFTLIELVAVIGLVVLLAGGVGLAFERGAGRGVALQSAQAEMAALLQAARSRAVLRQAPVRLFVAAEPPPGGDSARYLRGLRIAGEEPVGSGRWVSTTEPVSLPRETFVVPPVVAANLLAPGATWPTGAGAPLSTLLGPTEVLVDGVSEKSLYLEFEADGDVDSSTSQIALITGVQPSPQLSPVFNDPAGARGIRLRRSGSIGLINAAGDF